VIVQFSEIVKELLMKITIIAVGSRGDVQPCIALGRGLADTGYTVRIVTMETFKQMVLNEGLEFFPVEGDAQALTGDFMNSEMVSDGRNILVMFRAMLRTFGSITGSYEAAFSNEELFDSEAILCQLPGGFYGYDLAEALKIPYIALSVIPQEITGAWPLSLFPSRMSLGNWYNRLTYLMGQQLVWQPFRKSINRYRHQLGLSPTSFFWGNIRLMAQECVPVVQGFSEHVIPTQPEWGSHIHTTGYWTLDEPDWQPPKDLLDFLNAGSPPVFVGFGSMPVSDPQQTTALILDALKKTGSRCILNTGWANLGTTDLPDSVFLLDYAPYNWLFPQMDAVIHHGGSGTTGLALRSGVPSMVVPFTADQPFWGERTHDLGVGPSPIPFSKLSVDNLAHAVHTLTTNTTMRTNAMRLREAMADENGIEIAVQTIHKYLE
jgi:sterol 3beta-glucosyltransferase